MPSHVVVTPEDAGGRHGVRRFRVRRSAVAAGPMSSAVERIDPMAMDDRPTETARASMNSRPTTRRLMPRAEASSALTELRSSGR